MELRRACVQLGDRPALDHFDLKIGRGKWVAPVGANGCGKSTLLRALSGESRIQGESLLDGSSIAPTPRRLVAQRVALLPQQLPRAPGMMVRQLVAHGRFPQRSMWAMLRDPFDEHCAVALAGTGTTHLGDRMVNSLSGGECQRARLTLSLAQDASILLLDKPTTFLDICHRPEVLDLIARLRCARGLTVVLVLRDLEYAARYADRLVALGRGRIVVDGDPAAVVTPQLLEEVSAVTSHVGTDEYTGRLVVHIDPPRERLSQQLRPGSPLLSISSSPGHAYWV